MSNTYVYVSFAPGKQPTVEEVSIFKECCSQSSMRYAIGINADNGGLAIAFEEAIFRRSLSSNPKLARLLECWGARGGRLMEGVPFIKNPTALQPTRGGIVREKDDYSFEKMLRRKQLAAQESLGELSLKIHRTLQHYDWFHRFARVVPYALMGLGGLLVVTLGILLGRRLSARESETRRETIERVAEDAMQHSLTSQATGIAPELDPTSSE